MKKILVLSMFLAFSTNLTLAATSYTSALKDAVKKDIETSATTIKTKKTEKTKEIEEKIKALEEEKAELYKKASMSQAE